MKLWDYETMRLRNYETMKLWKIMKLTFKLSNYDTMKLWNYETMKPWDNYKILMRLFQTSEHTIANTSEDVNEAVTNGKIKREV